LLKQISSCHDYCKSQLKTLKFQCTQLDHNPDYEKIRNTQLVYKYIISNLVDLANRITSGNTSNIAYACDVQAVSITEINERLTAVDNYFTRNVPLPPSLVTSANIPVTRLPMTSNCSITLPAPYISDLSNCHMLLSVEGSVKTYASLPSSFDSFHFSSDVTKQKNWLLA
jgi:hypothetical protein